MTMNIDRKTLRETQVEPVAGIWACDNCGRRIQVVQDSEQDKVQPFICVCGTAMNPGEEHGQPDEDLQRSVVDD
jgi:hypothetical protein